MPRMAAPRFMPLVQLYAARAALRRSRGCGAVSWRERTTPPSPLGLGMGASGVDAVAKPTALFGSHASHGNTPSVHVERRWSSGGTP